MYNTYIQGALLDTVLYSKIDFLKLGATALKEKGDITSRLREGDIRLFILKLKPKPSLNDYYDAGSAYYKGNNLERADSLFEKITALFPIEKYGWERRYTIARINDSTMQKGTTIPFALKYLEVLEKDKEKNKKEIISTSAYLATYYANIVKDRTNSLIYLKKILALDPLNTEIQNNIKKLEEVKSN